MSEFASLKGKTIKRIDGLEKYSETVTFKLTDGTTWILKYYQDCCASCSVEDVVGDVEDLIGTPILLAEEVQSQEPSEEVQAERLAKYEADRQRYRDESGNEPWWLKKPSAANNWGQDSETWTFYKLATVKGYVTIRWYGSSNGYYSETATFHEKGKGPYEWNK